MYKVGFIVMIFNCVIAWFQKKILLAQYAENRLVEMFDLINFSLEVLFKLSGFDWVNFLLAFLQLVTLIQSPHGYLVLYIIQHASKIEFIWNEITHRNVWWAGFKCRILFSSCYDTNQFAGKVPYDYSWFHREYSWLQRVDIQKRNIVNNTSTFPGNFSYFQFNYGSGFENAHNWIVIKYTQLWFFSEYVVLMFLSNSRLKKEKFICSKYMNTLLNYIHLNRK